jgi:hypothetical protein
MAFEPALVRKPFIIVIVFRIIPPSAFEDHYRPDESPSSNDHCAPFVDQQIKRNVIMLRKGARDR